MPIGVVPKMWFSVGEGRGSKSIFSTGRGRKSSGQGLRECVNAALGVLRVVPVHGFGLGGIASGNADVVVRCGQILKEEFEY